MSDTSPVDAVFLEPTSVSVMKSVLLTPDQQLRAISLEQSVSLALLPSLDALAEGWGGSEGPSPDTSLSPAVTVSSAHSENTHRCSGDAMIQSIK